MTIDFSTLAKQLLADAPSLLRQWLPNGRLEGKEYRIGSIRGEAGKSLSINIETGVWKDFSEGTGGADLISLYAAINGIKQSQAAKTLGAEPAQTEHYITGEKCFTAPWSKHGKPTHLFEYRTPDNILYGYVGRFEPPDQPKQFMPLTAWKKDKGAIQWKWKKWPDKHYPYHAEKIAANPEAKILIVEGEKKADRAQKLMPPDWIVLGWPFGAGAVNKADWSPLKYRYCWIWPDNDEGGIKAAKALKRILPDLHIVTLPENLEPGWDLGDAPDGFDVLHYLRAPKKITSVAVTENETPSQNTHDRSRFILELNTRATPLPTIENMQKLFGLHGITVRYNEISKREEIIIPNENSSGLNSGNTNFARLISRMEEVNLPTKHAEEYVSYIAAKNTYNPALEWIKSKPWDGNSRLGEFYNTLTTKYPNERDCLMFRWLITAVALADKPEGLDSPGILVLQGGQGLGKTWWARKLVSADVRNELLRDSANINPHDKDSVFQLIRYWIVELGELNSSLDRADIAAIKAFATADRDIIRLPYARKEITYPRKTAICASVNDKFFLFDETGNRRFLTIPVTKVNSYHEIDMQQLWAEAYVLYQEGESWILNTKEREIVDKINAEHKAPHPIYEMIMQQFQWDSVLYDNNYMSATEIARVLGYKVITQRETRIISTTLRDIYKVSGKESGSERILDGVTLFKVPKPKKLATSIDIELYG